MQNRHKFCSGLILAAGTALVALPAFAHSGDCGPMDKWEKVHEQRHQRMQHHQKQLHDALKLTPEQEGAWQKFTQSMVSPQRPDKSLAGDWAKLTAPERAERMLDLAKMRQERMAEHLMTLKTFYAVLTPEQKKTFDDFHGVPRSGRRGPAQPGGTETNPAAPATPRG